MSPLTITEDAIWGYVTARCAELQVGHRAVRGPSRDWSLVRVRATIATELHLAPWELSNGQIGKALGNRHASTIWALLRGGKHK